SSLPPSGRPLPGWGQAFRRPGRTALVLAAFAGLSLVDGCSGQVPSATTSSTQIVLNSGPSRFRLALTVAMKFLDDLDRPASNPFHLVAFTGRALDMDGNTTAAVGSDWTFTFSRYLDSQPNQTYETVTIFVPGTGAVTRTLGTSKDPVLSPIENWDAAMDGTSPDSKDFVAPLKAKNIATAGASIELKQGVITIKAGGKTTTYNTADASFASVN
ncbi:MAG: hypothetical protein JWM80_356, partial [Cyanobacteria bacterium RYN_339]|nr:hypothetical protein [Cyanobacteria bacterium RYN_339]